MRVKAVHRARLASAQRGRSAFELFSASALLTKLHIEVGERERG